MAANNVPIFSKVGVINWSTTTLATVLAADYTGVGAHNVLAFTADATNGSFLRSLKLKAIGTNVATVARVYINNGSTNGTATNNFFFAEFSLPATTASTTTATTDIEIPLNVALPPGYKVYVGLGATVAAGWVVGGIGGNF